MSIFGGERGAEAGWIEGGRKVSSFSDSFQKCVCAGRWAVKGVVCHGEGWSVFHSLKSTSVDGLWRYRGHLRMSDFWEDGGKWDPTCRRIDLCQEEGPCLVWQGMRRADAGAMRRDSGWNLKVFPNEAFCFLSAEGNRVTYWRRGRAGHGGDK